METSSRLSAGQSPAAAFTKEQFLAFYDSAVGELFAYLFRATGGNRELAEDIAQEAFATALRHARQGDSAVLSIPWVITVGRNRLIDQWRRSAREQQRLSLVHSAGRCANPAEPDNAGDHSDHSDYGDHGDHGDRSGSELLARVRALPPTQQAAVALRYLDDLPVAQVAERLGKSVKATESLLSRARHTLRTTGGDSHD